ncbi:MAG: methyltransferase domain-containing protein, partial [Smithellaceae bacterium]|nr:methyltransferase domain-containing protein [Smithellaceae bacterium]
AIRKLGARFPIQEGVAEDLPFSDNEFDIVTLITTLEFVTDPAKAIAEAARVSRDRVFIGALNSLSFLGTRRKLAGLFVPSIYSKAHLFNIIEILGILEQNGYKDGISWGSVLFLPQAFYGFAANLEEAVPVMKNPFGAFLGVSFPVSTIYRTIQEPVREGFAITAKNGAPARGVTRRMER